MEASLPASRVSQQGGFHQLPVFTCSRETRAGRMKFLQKSIQYVFGTMQRWERKVSHQDGSNKHFQEFERDCDDRQTYVLFCCYFICKEFVLIVGLRKSKGCYFV